MVSSSGIAVLDIESRVWSRTLIPIGALDCYAVPEISVLALWRQVGFSIVAAAVAIAVYKAIGARISEILITPESSSSQQP